MTEWTTLVQAGPLARKIPMAAMARLISTMVAGTAPAVGVNLGVQTLQGGSATLGFQVEASCEAASVINRGEFSSSAGDEAAIAVTQCQ